jgi:hypothetical protein
MILEVDWQVLMSKFSIMCNDISEGLPATIMEALKLLKFQIISLKQYTLQSYWKILLAVFTQQSNIQSTTLIYMPNRNKKI